MRQGKATDRRAGLHGRVQIATDAATVTGQDTSHRQRFDGPTDGVMVGGQEQGAGVVHELGEDAATADDQNRPTGRITYHTDNQFRDRVGDHLFDQPSIVAVSDFAQACGHRIRGRQEFVRIRQTKGHGPELGLVPDIAANRLENERVFQAGPGVCQARPVGRGSGGNRQTVPGNPLFALGFIERVRSAR